MLLKVLYGDNRTLLCNACCASINLLQYIKDATGHHDADIDLADETGIVIELDEHKMEQAARYTSTNKFILVEKKCKEEDETDYDAAFPFTYQSLLTNYTELYPDLKGFYRMSQKGLMPQPPVNRGSPTRHLSTGLVGPRAKRVPSNKPLHRQTPSALRVTPSTAASRQSSSKKKL